MGLRGGKMGFGVRLGKVVIDVGLAYQVLDLNGK